MMSTERETLIKENEALKILLINTEKAAHEKDKELTKLKEDNAILEQKYTTLQQINANQDQINATLLQKCTNLGKENGDLKRNTTELEMEIIELEVRNATLKLEYENLEQKWITVKEKNTTLELEITALEEEKTALEQRSTALELTNATLEQEKTALEQKSTILEQIKTALEMTNAALEQDNAALEQRSTASEERNIALERNITTLEGNITTLEGNITTLEGNITTLEGNNTLLEQLHTKLEEENNSLSDELGKFIESQGASTSGILTLTTSLSKPFIRLDKYPTLLQELERHVEEAHPDYGDIIKATAAFKSLVSQCQDLRKRKNLELQILSEPVRGWEGDGMKSLGQVAYTSQVHVRNGASEEKEERYLMLFPNVLVMLSASPRMSGFIYQGKLSLTGTTVTRQVEDGENAPHAFDITGGMVDRFSVFCSSAQELQEWLEHLQPYTKSGSPAGTISKTVDGKPLSAVGSPTHLPHLGGPSAVSRGPLEPPKTSKPWTLSCLRPAPPLKPSAALGYKERMSYIMKDSSKSPRPIKKFLPGNRKKDRKPSDDEFQIRKSTAALEEDAQILRVIEAYCTGASLHQTTTAVRKECVPQVLLPEEEKIIVEEIKSNGQTVTEEKSLVDAVYALKDEVHELKKENKWMKQFLEEEQKSRKELERLVRKLSKQKNDCGWEDSSH
ncbi:rho guanine nucleotide exchange factor 6 isoform X3 [Poecilia reticulata]|uniref:rho guanine nucleotide exchange factor 6 isoform X3 n=1 Tax=Poecilia reticulata TaxID=8081 RepID=UPI0004A2F13B|nr:PREDICTED: rho guanine nucleotide exchange factor 6 isoform X3 [Poecilia reticulata]